MCQAKKERRQVFRGTSLAASSVLLSTILLAGCSSVGDSLNPVGWYKGVSDWASGAPSSSASASAKDSPADESGFPTIQNDKRPDVSSTKDRSELSKGLAADRSNAKYTQDVLRRDGNPTHPLSVDAAASGSAVASAPGKTVSAVAPPPAVTTEKVATAADLATVSDKPSVALDDAPPPPPRKLSADSAVTAPAPAADAAPVVKSSTTSAAKVIAAASPTSSSSASATVVSASSTPAASTVASVSAAPVATPVPTPAPVSAAPVVTPVPTPVPVSAAPVATPVPTPVPVSAAPVATPTPAPAPVQVAAASAPLAMTAPAAPPAASVEEVYRQRLAEFNAGTVPAAVPAVSSPAAKEAVVSPAVADVDSGTVLISPAEYRRKLAHDNGGARPLEAFDASHSAASFQVAAVRFGEGTAALSAGEQQHLKDVAALYREKGGEIRIFGRSASPRLEMDAKANQAANRQLAGGRAASIARELVKLGVPARKIFAGAAAASASASASAVNGETTEIYIDY